MRGRACMVLLAGLSAGVAPAQPGHYRIDPAQTRIEFEVLHLGVLRAQGRFLQASGNLDYDALGQEGRVEIDVVGASISTGWTLRDAFLRGENMFDVDRHPVVRFRSTHLVFAGGHLASVVGDLTLRGVTRPVTLAVTGMDCGDAGRSRCVAAVAGTLHRRDYGMDFAWPLIGDEVALRFALVAVRDGPVTASPLPAP